MTATSKKINEALVVREFDINIVSLVADGKKAKEIGDTVNISSRGVEKRLEQLREAFDCVNTPHLVATFFRNGLIK